MHKKFEVNWTKIKGGCQSGRKAAELISTSKLSLVQVVETLKVKYAKFEANICHLGAI